MYRLKNNYELENSGPDECVLAHCHNIAEKLYSNGESHIIDVCLEHYDKLCKLRYGE
jgi:hypothetical protein